MPQTKITEPSNVKITSKKLATPKTERDVLLGNSGNCPNSKYCFVNFGSISCKALFDTGADVSLIDQKTFRKIPKELKTKIDDENQITLRSVTGHTLEFLGTSLVTLQLQNYKFKFRFFISNQLGKGKEIILGSDLLEKYKAKWDFEHSTLQLNECKIKLYTKEKEHYDISLAAKLDYTDKLSHLSKENSEQFAKVLSQNSHIFSQSETDLGKTPLVKMSINTNDHKPIKQKPYKTPFSLRPAVENHVEEMLKADIIRPSTSPWASPIIIVPKKDGGSRVCIDFRKLNQVTVTNSYPLPSISDILASMKDAKVFSCLDLKSGYYQIEMEESDKEKTAFVCFKGLFEFNVMPFGLCSAPPVFQELMNRVLGDAINNYAFAYIDDIIIYSPDIQTHLIHLQTIFDKLKSAQLKLKLSKCNFGVSKVTYLGHEISGNGVRPEPTKVESIQNIKTPSTVKQVRSFLGLVGFYRQFIQNFAEIAQPLTQLTRKFCRFKWNPDCQRAFDTLKQRLCETVVLAHPDQIRPYSLCRDASQNAVSAVLI